MSILLCTFFIHLARFAWLCYGSDSFFHSFPVYCRFHFLLETCMPGVLEIVVIPFRCTPLQWLWYYKPTCIVYTTSFSRSWSSSPLSRTALRFKNCLSVMSAFWASTISFTVKGFISSFSLRFANTMIHLSRIRFDWVLCFVVEQDQNFENISPLAAFPLSWTSHAWHDCTH